MIQMQAQPKLTHQVERHDEWILKGMDDLPIDISMSFDVEAIGSKGIDDAGRQMQQVEDDEEQEREAGDGHGAGRKRCLAILADRIGDRASTAISHAQLDGQHDVDDRDAQQPYSGRPQQNRHLAEKRRVTVERMRSFEYLKIPQHVEDDIADEAKSGQSDDDFVADRGLERLRRAFHLWALYTAWIHEDSRECWRRVVMNEGTAACVGSRVVICSFL